MTALALPALDGRSPLGFLAALGVLRLITESTDPTSRLAWSCEDCTAILHSRHATIDELVADLTAIAASIPADGALPGLPADFPPPGAAPDKLRLPRQQLRRLAERIWQDTGSAGERWIASLVTDLSLDDKGRADISLYTAPSGKQSMRTMLEKPLAIIRANPDVLREAITAWRRYPGVTGEYLDHKVLYDAADAPDGKAMERGVPGATWLALMAYPLLHTTATGGEPITTGWQRTGPKGRARQLLYPLWSTPLDIPAAMAVWQHPVLAGAKPGPPPSDARLLSIFLVCCAHRRRVPGRNFAGVLTPVRASSGDVSRSTSSAKGRS